MPADLILSREDTERLERTCLERWANRDLSRVMATLRRALSEPARLAQARAEGYREGVEAAAQELSQKAAAAEERAGRSSKQDRVLARYAADLYGRAASGLRALLQGGSDAG